MSYPYSEQWVQAIQKGIDWLEKNKAWEFISISEVKAKRKLPNNKLLLKIKCNINNDIA